MNEQHTSYLVENFPNLYAEVGLSPQESCMAFGLECGDGWFDIIRELSEKIEPLGAVASQVKEKWGELRFYVSNGTDEIFDLIDKAEQKSAETCELCGEPGRTTGSGWIRTHCSECE